jgi:hypothetical protein
MFSQGLASRAPDTNTTSLGNQCSDRATAILNFADFIMRQKQTETVSCVRLNLLSNMLEEHMKDIKSKNHRKVLSLCVYGLIRTERAHVKQVQNAERTATAYGLVVHISSGCVAKINIL